MDWILLGIPAGIVLLYYGSEWMVDGAKNIALRYGVAPFVVGLTVVAFGSSAPEAVTSLVSGDNPQIILGNIVGSNTANVGLAIGLAALIAPIACAYRAIRFELISMMVSVFMITLLSLTGILTPLYGVILVLSLFLFVYLVYRYKKGGDSEESILPDKEEKGEATKSKGICAVMVVLGILALYFGARLFIDGAVSLAGLIGISDMLVGLIVVAVGTSLPELCICIMAAYRKENELVVSNIVGSIVFNSFFALGVGLLVTSIPVTHYMMVFHMPVMILMTGMLFVMIRSGNSISRSEGGLLVAVYAAYIALMAFYPELTQGMV